MFLLPPASCYIGGERFSVAMSEDRQPFTEQITRASRASGGPGGARTAWTCAGVSAVLLIAALILWATAVGKLNGLQRVQTRLEDANGNLANALAENEKLKDQVASLQTQIGDLQKERDLAAQMSKSLENEMRADLESKDVTISKLQGKLTVNILDRVMFDSGEAILKPEGEAVLQKIAALLAGHPTLKIHVIGHTDNVPMHNARFASNWELSAARALAAVHFLTERGGVDPRRVGAVGYGEYRPIADNSTSEGRAKNRRIAITILPDELAGADTVSEAKPADVADPPPKPEAATLPPTSPGIEPPAPN
jgi:chemotaxis protein MotB